MIYVLYFLLTLLGIVLVLFVPILFCIHIVRTRPHSKLGIWLRRNVITEIDLEPIKREPLEKGLLDDDVLEPPMKG
jgi:inner membrane protein involved in colicin E2 resistance